MKLNQKVTEMVESGIEPISLQYERVHFFDDGPSIVRSFLGINSLDIGALDYPQYRFVVARCKQSEQMVGCHVTKLLRAIHYKLTNQEGSVLCYTIPVYARTLRDGMLSRILFEEFAKFPDVPPSMVCVEISADILYEDMEWVEKEMRELGNLGVKIAMSEVGDEFCPIFRLASLPFDYVLLDPFATRVALSDRAENSAEWLIEYLHDRNARVIAPGLDTAAKIDAVRELDCDGYTVADSYVEEVV